MKDRIAFESSVMEKSRHLIQKRKQKRKAAMYTATSLCTCFIIAFGVFMTAPSLSKKAFDAAAPESAGGVADDYYYYVNEDALPNYSTADGANGSTVKDTSLKTETEHDDDSGKFAVTSTAATPYQPSVPTTTTASPTTTVPQIYPEQEKGTANYIKSYASSASVYTKEIAKNTKAPDEIHFLVDKAFAKEDTIKEKDDIHTVKVVFTVGSEKYTFFLTEADVQGIVP